jgi:hypothetical protein
MGSRSTCITRNFLFDLENDAIVCPSRLIATLPSDSSSEHSRRSAIRTGTARIAPSCALFLQYSSSPSLLVRPTSDADSTTLSLYPVGTASRAIRPGNVHSAEDWEEVLLPEIARQQEAGKEVVFRADAAFAKAEIYEGLEERGVKYAIRLPANDNLLRDIEELLTRPVGAAQSQTDRVVQGLSLPSRELGNGTKSSGEGRVSCWGVVPACGVHRNEPGDAEPGGGAVLQQARDGGAVDRGEQAGRKDDPFILSSFPLEPSAAGAEPASLQLGQFVAAAGFAERD